MVSLPCLIGQCRLPAQIDSLVPIVTRVCALANARVCPRLSLPRLCTSGHPNLIPSASITIQWHIKCPPPPHTHTIGVRNMRTRHIGRACSPGLLRMRPRHRSRVPEEVWPCFWIPPAMCLISCRPGNTPHIHVHDTRLSGHNKVYSRPGTPHACRKVFVLAQASAAIGW